MGKHRLNINITTEQQEFILGFDFNCNKFLQGKTDFLLTLISNQIDFCTKELDIKINEIDWNFFTSIVDTSNYSKDSSAKAFIISASESWLSKTGVSRNIVDVPVSAFLDSLTEFECFCLLYKIMNLRKLNY